MGVAAIWFSRALFAARTVFTRFREEPVKDAGLETVIIVVLPEQPDEARPAPCQTPTVG
jgi:hypothetical protein